MWNSGLPEAQHQLGTLHHFAEFRIQADHAQVRPAADVARSTTAIPLQSEHLLECVPATSAIIGSQLAEYPVFV